MVYTYTYSSPIFGHNDNPGLDYFSDFRGHKVVTVTDSSGAIGEYRFYRGMEGDNGNYSDQITLSDGSTRTDYNWLKGQVAEVRRIGTAGVLTNTPLQDTVNVYTWTLTAGSGREGAYFAGTQIVTDTVYGTITKTTQDETVYDAYGNVTREIQRGDVSTTADDRTVERSYVYNTTANIVDTLQWEKQWSGASPGNSGEEKLYSCYFP
jgi:hypothetical protein